MVLKKEKDVEVRSKNFTDFLVGNDGYTSIIESGSGGLVVGKAQFRGFPFEGQAHYQELMPRHCVPEAVMATSIVKSFKNWESTTVYGWELTRLITYEPGDRWHYTGRLQGNPTFVKLDPQHMPFTAKAILDYIYI